MTTQPTHDIEKMIDQILEGVQPESMDDDLFIQVQTIIKDLDDIRPDADFKMKLTEKITEKLEKKSPVLWKKWKFWLASLSTVGVLAVVGFFVLPDAHIGRSVDPSTVFDHLNGDIKLELKKPNRIQPIRQKSMLIDENDNPNIIKNSTTSWSDNSSILDSLSDKLSLKRKSQNKIESKKMMQQAMPQSENFAGNIAYDGGVDMFYEQEIFPIDPDDFPRKEQEKNREKYDKLEDNPLQKVSENPVSTFSIDVDTGSYTNVRRAINDGYKPSREMVRIEEMVNYFSYDYRSPDTKKVPFSVNNEVIQTPWNKNTKLIQIGIKGYEHMGEDRPDANLVFLLDISGSMNNDDKLPLLKKSLKMLAKNMKKSDKISIVTYAGNTATVLSGADGDDFSTIDSAMSHLNAGGGTAGSSGINMAYAEAKKHFIKGGINRILLATDGDFNVGVTNFDTLKEMVEEKRKSGISLSTLGFGSGNYNDHLMEQLANNGNGNYAYIDSILEAKKVLVTEMGSTLETIAKDVKIQVEFNPDMVSEYRLIGYVNRKLAREDFNNDTVDAGEIGAGHTVTALYEIALVGEGGAKIDDLRYEKKGDKFNGKESEEKISGNFSDELAFLKLRHKKPNGDVSELTTYPILRSDINDEPSQNIRFASSVAAFGQKLRGNKYLNNFNYDDIIRLAKSAKGADEFGYRAEFLRLVEQVELMETP